RIDAYTVSIPDQADRLVSTHHFIHNYHPPYSRPAGFSRVLHMQSILSKQTGKVQPQPQSSLFSLLLFRVPYAVDQAHLPEAAGDSTGEEHLGERYNQSQEH